MQQVSPAQSIPRAIHRMAARQQLGAPYMACTPRTPMYMYYLVGPLIVIVGIGIITAFALSYSFFRDWPLWQALLIPLVGAGWIGVGLWIMLTPWLYPRLRVFVCPDGLICLRRKAQIIRWNQVEQLWRSAHREANGKLSYSYRIQLRAGPGIVFASDLCNAEMLGALVEDEIIHNQLNASFADYEAGVPLIFGDIIVSLQGIGLKHMPEIVAWNEVENIDIKDTTMSIYKKGLARAWSQLDIARVANVGVLTRLLEYIKQRPVQPQLPQLKAYYAGMYLRFGHLQLSLQGVSLDNGRTLFPWSEIGSIGVGPGEVMLKRRGEPSEWYALSRRMIDDVATLKKVLEHILNSDKVL
ncbi:hypothetical protein EPA93_33590 [Ktedonosporobacter rubrisoli]|uniref:Uncharacterized protein n=1 Tax=Ktedonosporobacter rubrisoli TaxID=2509675 RepID=A0A4P6JYS9_KTERU|nr:DUF6585 family protein [Ktedonosporobacter rubrisoli]QBD80643.1 hypothetical protein EPA93_33590 [Ktedonosporobacter rubrisoli]